MEGIERIRIDGEEVCFKKSGIFGWNVVHPHKNEDGSINWPNLIFGGKGNMITLIFILICLGMIIGGVTVMLDSCRQMAENPCAFADCCNYTTDLTKIFVGI